MSRNSVAKWLQASVFRTFTLDLLLLLDKIFLIIYSHFEWFKKSIFQNDLFSERPDLNQKSLHNHRLKCRLCTLFHLCTERSTLIIISQFHFLLNGSISKKIAIIKIRWWIVVGIYSVNILLYFSESLNLDGLWCVS